MDLSTQYLGMKLKNPLVVSACGPLSESLDRMKRLEDAGASAIVMYSLFEEEIRLHSEDLDRLVDYGTESFPEALSYFPEMADWEKGPERYFDLLSQASEALTIPIIGSLNCTHRGSWADYAAKFQAAGAAAVELNFYHLAADPGHSGASIEDECVAIAESVSTRIKIPLAVKLHPFFSSLPHLAARLANAGARGLVLFNRFYQPDIDLDTLEVAPRLHLSSSTDLLLPLRWTAILAGRISADIALTSGVHTAADAMKAMLAGAKVAMMASELLQHGPQRISEILLDMKAYLQEKEYQSISQLQGSVSQLHVPDPDAFERANYMKVIKSFRGDPTGYWH